MNWWALWFWLFLTSLFELSNARHFSYALALVLGLIIGVGGFLFSIDFDLLGSTLIVTYGAVFTVLGLFGLQFAAIGGPALRSPHGPSVIYLGLCSMCLALATVYCNWVSGQEWALCFVWQDISNVGFVELFLGALVAHELFYRFFVWELL